MTSIIKVDNLQNQCGANIISESANVITIGASGDTVTLAAGASQSGFGRTGTVNWDTTKKTTGFTSVSGNGYFCDTTSSAFTATLPATPSAGDIVSFSDYTGTFLTNNLTIGRNGSNIRASATDLILNVNNQTVTLIYVDATEGWNVVQESNNINNFVTATGGTITTCGNYKIHTFTGPGTFTVTNAGNAAGSNSVDYLVVAGGGGGGRNGPGPAGASGGGGGGYRESKATGAPWTASPLASSTSLPVSVTGYPITVGSGGAGSSSATNTPAANGSSGVNSIFSTITSAGGGGGGGSVATNGISGGSGGGGFPTGGSGNTPPVAPPQGQPGGAGVNASGGGAGGTGPNGPSGAGAVGTTTSISGSPLAYAGGAGGMTGGATSPCGTGGSASPSNTSNATAGTTNRGGGGGGMGSGGCVNTVNGGSGVVVIRYKFQ